ncbi:MAG: HAD-IA family hydrolase [Nanoarchaeota archaeon]
MIKAIIFDFDGVIADSLPAVEKAARKAMIRLKYPFPVISRDDSLWNIITRKMKLNIFQRLRLIKAIKKEVVPFIRDISVFAGMRELLIELQKKYKVIILSSNSMETISTLLSKYKFPQIEIVSDTSLFKKDKKLKRLLKKKGLSTEEAVYIGDEVRDVEACKRANIEIFAVNWGYNSEKALRKAGATHIIRKPEEILRFLQK